jgi:type I restriction enzyme R subunit
MEDNRGVSVAVNKPTNLTESAFEALIVADLLSEGGYTQGDPADYDRTNCLDTRVLLGFIEATQPEVFRKLALGEDGDRRLDFLARLRGDVTGRGVLEVLRTGVLHREHTVRVYYGIPTPGNDTAARRYAQNRLTVVRQLRYSGDHWQRAVDLVLFVNGLPVVTFELKNTLTKQTAQDAVEQYRRDRDPNELLFRFGRCVVHFAVDDQQVFMCSELRGRESVFLPFNRGRDGGAGNPPGEGVATDYLWRTMLSRDSLCDILDNFAQVVTEPDRDGRKRRRLVFPRYHQLTAVRRLLTHARAHGVGQRYLVQHSAGSGKSNTIAWLTHPLIGLQHQGATLFDSVIVVTDRTVLDRQLRDSVRRFAHASSIVGEARSAGDLARFLRDGKKVITTTVQKFPFVLEELEAEPKQRRFAVVIDEAHSSHGGAMTSSMNAALGDAPAARDDDDYEDAIHRIIERRGLLKNASYFAFTATPKNHTLEMFGERRLTGEQGARRPFHVYSMRQAIEEGFILDVLKHFTPVTSYYNLVKTVAADPRFDVERAFKKLHAFVQGADTSVRLKTEVMLDHFEAEVLARRKVGGKARAMVVTSSIDAAIAYKAAFDRDLARRGGKHRAIVAFSGEREVDGVATDESRINGFPSAEIPERIRAEPYRFLIVADKFQTGYDEPLLHTMYVDKRLSGPKAVQTLSRLNRVTPEKYDCFVLDFENSVETIRAAFTDYYTTTVLAEETNPDRLHDLKAELDGWQVYADHQVKALVSLYLSGARRDRLDPILDVCVQEYRGLDEEGQVAFKGKAKAFLRAYNFLASVLTFKVAAWEELAIFLDMLVPRLPAPKESDLSRGILEMISLESYRVEKQAELAIQLPTGEALIHPTPVGDNTPRVDPVLEYLSMILKQFHERFGGADWADKETMGRLVAEELPRRVAADVSYQNALKNSDRQNARIEHDRALEQVIVDLVTDHAELFKQFEENSDFRRWLTDHSFRLSADLQRRG